MKTYAVWGAPASCKGASWEDSFKTSGNNFGNILIGNGLLSNLQHARILSLHHAQETGLIRECSRVLIPAANFLWKGFDLGFLSDQLERIDLPLTMVGLGAQSADRIHRPPITAGTERLIRLVASRSASIGVRGYYTAEVLSSLGITNVDVLGCPAFYTTGLTGFASIPLEPFKNVEPDSLNACINLSRRVCKHSFFPDAMRAAENLIVQYGISRGSPFIAQDEIQEIAASLGDSSCSLNDACNYFCAVPRGDILRYFKENTHIFCDVYEWSSFVSGFDLVLGTRFHGCLIALLSGVPALLLVHDSRTLEMAELAGIPYVLADSIVSRESLREAICSINLSLFQNNMNSLSMRFNHFLRKHDLLGEL